VKLAEKRVIEAAKNLTGKFVLSFNMTQAYPNHPEAPFEIDSTDEIATLVEAVSKLELTRKKQRR
jgi:hypothetical protein